VVYCRDYKGADMAHEIIQPKTVTVSQTMVGQYWLGPKKLLSNSGYGILKRYLMQFSTIELTNTCRL